MGKSSRKTNKNLPYLVDESCKEMQRRQHDEGNLHRTVFILIGLIHYPHVIIF